MNNNNMNNNKMNNNNNGCYAYLLICDFRDSVVCFADTFSSFHCDFN